MTIVSVYIFKRRGIRWNLTNIKFTKYEINFEDLSLS